MTKKPVTSVTGRNTPKPIDFKNAPKGRKGVQSLSRFVTIEEGTKLSDLIGQTIYVVKMEPTQSEQFGDGFNLFYKETPTARETHRTYTYGQAVVPILTELYKNSHEGKLISLDSPVKVEVYQAGRATLIR